MVIFFIFSLTLFSLSVSANVFINEIMPSPSNVDWDLSGTASSSDEWIELYNNGTQAVNLSGWILNDTLGTSTTNFVVPSNYALLQPNDFTVFYKAKIGSTFATQITLDTNGDTINLYDNTNGLIDAMTYSSNPGSDVAFGRISDGTDIFDNLTYPTPGTENGYCTVPRDDLYLVTNTILCNGSYELADLASNGVLVVFGDNVTLDFNQASISGDSLGVGVSLVDNNAQKTSSRDVTIINANIHNYYIGIAGINTTNIFIHDVLVNLTGIGIEMQNSNLTYIQDSYVLDAYEEGISGFNTADFTLDRVTLTGNANALVLNYSSNFLALDSKFTSSADNDILLKDKTNIYLLNTTFSSLNFSSSSDSEAAINHYVIAKILDVNGPLASALVSATDVFDNLVLADTTDGLGRTNDSAMFTDYLQNATNTISFNNYTFKINSTDSKHLLLQESRNVDHSGEYVFTLSLEQVKPNVQLISPSDNAIVKGMLEFNIFSYDNAVLNNVSFYVNNALKQINYSNKTNELFTFNWNSSEVNDGNHTLKAVVFDTAGNSNSTEIIVQVNNVNLAPTMTSTAITSATEDVLYQYDVDAADADPGESSTLVFSLVTMPSGMTINSSTGLIAWTPANSQVGNNTVTVRVNDSSDAMAEQQFTINVTAVNDAPMFVQTLENLNVNEDATLYYDVNCTDEETTNLTYYKNATQFAINPASGNFTWTPTNDDVGSHNVNFICSDGELNTSQAITITVANTNDAPSLNTVGSNNTVEAVEDSLLTFLLSVSDDDTKNQENIEYFANDTRFTITKINNTFANVTFLPNNNDVGKFTVKFTVNDSSNVNSSLNVVINVTNTNDAPVLNNVETNNIVQAIEDSAVAFTLAADDDDLPHGSAVGESLTYTANDTRFTVTKINDTLANVTFLPVNSDVPTTSVKFTVTDKNNASSTQTVQINVTNTNDAPQITAFYPIFEDPKISELGLQMFNITAVDVDLNDNLVYTWEAKDNNNNNNNNSFNSLLSVDASDNKKANFTANGTTGNFVVKVSVKDFSNVTAAKTWNLTVADRPVASTFDSSLTTNFSATANLSDVANVTLGKSVSSGGGQPTQVLGLVSFKQNLDLSNVVDLDNLINISKGFVRIDSKQLPALNKSAKLTMQTL
ncbi:lamin tail domain-containing protein, partial [Candidatus Woesearchaeota archaeon]|nr:lamin tail domain-containing protein [Candidatus Woesearchaeota archaeon]